MVYERLVRFHTRLEKVVTRIQKTHTITTIHKALVGPRKVFEGPHKF